MVWGVGGMQDRISRTVGELFVISVEIFMKLGRHSMLFDSFPCLSPPPWLLVLVVARRPHP